MNKLIFSVSEETKRKRRWTLGVLVVLLVISLVMLGIGSPFSKDISLAYTSGFVIALIIKITDWVENSKFVKEK